MSLVADYTSDSEDSNDAEEAKCAREDNQEVEKLPVPEFLSSLLSKPVSTSVFSNPFVEAENAKTSALEKHVKMVGGCTAMTKNGRKICWNYRKGRCRFGHKCKYAHDSDVDVSDTCQRDEVVPSDAKVLLNKSKRKRPGLCQGITPSKKVVKMYQKLKETPLNT